MKHTFKQRIDAKVRDSEEHMTATTEQISTEPMVYAADLEFAYENGSVITKKVIDQLRIRLASDGVDVNDIVVDTRVNMVMPGMYPSIPGWHCDDVPRTDESNGQPDLSLVDAECVHYMILISDTGATRTEFVYNEYECEIDPTDVWESLNTEIIHDTPNTMFVPEGRFVKFNQQAIHRASIAKSSGWRYFFRATARGPRTPVNRMRTQVQVYITKIGW
jgi:hypothetical protein